MDFIDAQIYPIPVGTSKIVLGLNFFIPGLGTIIQCYYAEGGWNLGTFGIGWLQGLLAPFVIGWIWAVYHGW